MRRHKVPPVPQPDLGDIMVEVLDVNGDLQGTKAFLVKDHKKAWRYYEKQKFAVMLRYGGWEEIERKP